MKILVTSTGDSLESEVDPRFGRAKKFILYETDDSSFLVIDNQQNVEALQGAGVQASQTVVNSEAEVLITGNCGPNAFRILSETGVKVFIGAKGKIKEAIEDFQNGKLEQAKQANVGGHWV